MFTFRHCAISVNKSPSLLVRGLFTSSIDCAMLQSPRGALKYEEKGAEFVEGDFKTRWRLAKEDFADMIKFISSWENWSRYIFKRRLRNPIRNLRSILLDDVFTVSDFSKPEEITKWKLGSDRIWNEGYSTCRLEYNNGGYSTFSGYLDSTNLPKDGMISRVGYVNMTLFEAPEFVSWNNQFNLEPWTHLTLKLRGDGRRWLVILGQRGDSNQNWDDKYVTWLPTHGGPYWQEVKIPFSKFFLGAFGRMQEPQVRIDPWPVTYIGLTLCDGRTGPFRLDIKNLGFLCDNRNFEDFAYESYYVPQHRYPYLD